MRVAVIGAGSAGLAALRHCTASSATNDASADAGNPRNITEVICYEKTDQVGGTWVYTPDTGVDRYGLPIHSSMYDSLRQVDRSWTKHKKILKVQNITST